MHYGELKTCDIANGAGVRVTLFVSGCTNRCPGCFQPQTWDFSYGSEFTDEVADALIESLRPAYVTGLTLLGGEPMEPDNQRALVGLLERVRAELPSKSIWCYTGDVYEQLLPGGAHHTDVTDRILSCLDVLVDGPWVRELHDITLRFRGSSNQRLIDVPATLEAHAAGELSGNDVVLWEDDPVFATHTMQ
jgi:anaerobic ribonucleoside-triphosphate reductase activating protein